MSQLIPPSPLMQPVECQGQTYYASQYFHSQSCMKGQVYGA